MYNDKKGVLIRDKGFPRGEREKRGRKDTAGHYNKVSLQEPRIIWKSTAVRRTICMNTDQPYRQPSPRICCACLLTLAYNLSCYLTESNFSHIVYSWCYRLKGNI